MDIFKSSLFTRFAKKEKISAAVLNDAVDRAERGLIDADLGAGVIKQRIARPGEGEFKGLSNDSSVSSPASVFLCL